MVKRSLAKLIKGTAPQLRSDTHAPPPAKAQKLAQGAAARPPAAKPGSTQKQTKGSQHTAGTQKQGHSKQDAAGYHHQASLHAAADEMGEEGAVPAGDAYNALVSMLSSGQGSVSEALRRRRREAEGEGSGSEIESEGVEGEDSECGSDSSSDAEELDVEQLRSRKQQAGAAASGSERVEEGKGKGQDGAQEDEGQHVNEDKGSSDAEGDDARHKPSEADAQGLGTSSRDGGAAEDGQQQQQQNSAHLPPPEDTWELHVERVLTDSQIEELQGQSTRPKYGDVHHPDHQGLLPPHCHWQAAQRQGLPPAPPTLDAYSIKERLQTRWREVHGRDRQEQQEAAAGRAAAAGAAAASQAAAEGGHARDGGGDGKRPRGQRPKEMKQEQQARKEEEQRITQGIGEAGRGSGGAFVSGWQRSFFAALHSYADVSMPCRPYLTNMQDPDPLMDAYLLHCLNHVAKTADRIKRNNTRLEAASKQSAEGGSVGVEDVPRDQGFTRPKVLILIPQRNLAFKLVVRLVALAMKETRADSVQGKERFVEQFTDPEAEEENMDEGTRTRRNAKPADWRALLSGNTDDHFRLGIKITRGAIRLFSDLFDSDIIVASPLGLATKLAEDKRRAAGKVDRGKYATAAAAKAAKAAGSGGDAGGGSDFLSSIEVLVMDRADVMAMQNWTHVETVVEALNQLPRQQHGVDIMRVREWQLSGWARHYRQNILLSSFLNPEMNALVGGPLCSNHAGRLRVRQEEQGVLSRVVPQVQQVFERFKAASPTAMPDARFEYFKHVVWPRLKDACGGGGILLFVPQYFDFVRIRNFLASEDADLFETISEYTAPPDVTAARSRFYYRRVKLLVYTERAHFYHRHRIRGIKDIMFYAPPEHSHFYPDLLNLMEDTSKGLQQDTLAHHSTVGLLFCRWDALSLERLVGVSRAKKMITGESSTFMFC